MTLEKRVTRLEEKMTPPDIDKTNVFVWFVEPGARDQECVRLEHAGQVWDRISGEHEDDFKSRAVIDSKSDDRVTLFFVNR